MRNTVVLLTDFGLQDPYVGIMKGVMLEINPTLQFVDLSHEIPQFCPQIASFVLQTSYSYFPKGTIFLLVVDPEVGSKRKAIILKSGDRFFVGPDNGVFTSLLDKQFIAYELKIPPCASSTFHGRDVFSKAAAKLSLGISPARLGKPIKKLVKLPLVYPKVFKKKIEGKIIYIDKFGNLITNIPEDLLPQGQMIEILIKKVQIKGCKKFYRQTKVGELLALIGSSGYLEIAARERSAKDILQATWGTQVKVTW